MLPRYTIDLIRENAARFQRQTDSVALMPLLPRQLILLCDTALELYAKLEKKDV